MLGDVSGRDNHLIWGVSKGNALFQCEWASAQHYPVDSGEGLDFLLMD